MRHLMSPLDFTVEELNNLLDLAQEISKHTARNMRMPVTVKRSPHCSMSRVHVHG